MAGWRKDDKSPGPRKSIKTTQIAGGDSPSPSTGSASSSSTPSWKTGRQAAASKPFWVQGGARSPGGRNKWLFASAVALVTVAVIFVFSLMPRGDATDCIVLTGLSFDSPWQPNSWAKEDAERFKSWFKSSEGLQALQCRAYYDEATAPFGREWDWKNILETQIKQAQAGGPGGSEFSWNKYKSLVIYISAHSFVDDGQPKLAFSNKSIADFSEVLESISTVNDSWRVLVLIDQGRQLPDARIPVFSTEFFDLARQVVENKKRPHLAVMFSASQGQISWPAPELGGTIFGAYVAQGFTGAADKNKDSRITVEEIAGYLQQEVKDYALQSRAAEQTPELVWSSQKKDFDLAYCDPTKARSAAPATPDPNTVARLSAAWNRFQSWRDARLKDNPWLVAKVRNEIGYSDQLAWAGDYYAILANAKLSSADAAMKEVASRTANLAGTSRFQGAARPPEFKLPHDASPAVDTAPAKASADAKDKPDDQPKAPATPPPVTPTAPAAKPTFADLALDWLRTPPPADGGKLPAAPQTKELDEFLRFAWWYLKQSPEHWSQRSLDGLSKLWPPIAQAPLDVRMEDALLRQVIEDSQGIANLWDADGGVNAQWPALISTLDQIQTSFYRVLENEPRLLLDSASRLALESGLQTWRHERDELHARKVVSETLSPGSVKATEQSLKALASKWQLLDQSLDELPLVANWLFEASLQSKLASALDEAKKLSRDINADSTTLARLLDELRGRYRTEVNELLHDQQGLTKKLMPETLHDIYLHLHHLPVDTSQRRELHENLLAHYQAFSPDGAKLANNIAKEDIQPLKRKLAFDYAMLGLFPPLLNLDTHSSPDQTNSQQLWRSMLQQIATSLGRHEQVSAGQSEMKVAAMAVRLSTNWLPTPPTYDAARLQEESAWQDYLLWRADGLANDFWRTPELMADASRPYFAICAQAFLDESDKLLHAPKQPRLDATERLKQRVAQSMRWPEILASGSPEIDKERKTVTVSLQTDAYPAGVARNWARLKRLGDWSAQHLVTSAVGVKASRTPFALPAEEGKLACDYRGHTSSLPFEFGRPKLQWSLENDFVRDEHTTLEVATQPQPFEIVFALDCSGSFKPEDFETAKNNLVSALRALKGRPNVKVALVVFGHSNTWINKINPDWQAKYPTLVGSDFSTDVATLEDLVDITPAVVERIEQDYLPNLRPYGNTPLYYATVHSKKLLDRSFQADKATNILRRVILITDGLNMVVPTSNGEPDGPPLTQYPVKVNTPIDDVSKAFTSGANAQLNVLHIGSGKDARLEAVAKQTEGQYLNATFGNLEDLLSKTLEPLRYSVVHPNQRKAGDVAGQLPFGTETQLEMTEGSKSAERRQVVVTYFRNKITEELGRLEVEIYAGDRLKLEYDRVKGLFTFPFDGYRDLPLRLSPALQAWRLDSRDNYRDVRFVIDQIKRTEQTLRPKWAFIEVGTRGNKPKPLFWSSDVYWESGELRPTGRVTFSGPSADQSLPARLWLCQATEGPDIVGSIEMKDVYQAGVDKPRELPGKFIVRAEGQSQAGKYLLEISVVSSNGRRLLASVPPPSRVKHQFFEDGRVVYRYEYDSGKPSGTLNFYQAPQDSDSKWISTEWAE